MSQDEPQQIDQFTDVAYLDKFSRLDDAVEDIRRRFGKRAIFSACLLDIKMPVDGRDKVRMPGMMYK